MGGEAAKERRRLKRLEAQQGGEAGKATQPPGEKSAPSGGGESKSTWKKANGEENDIEAVRLRLQRKMARKASGRFKAQQSEQPPPPPSSRPNSAAQKRKSDHGGADDGGQTYKKSPRPGFSTTYGTSPRNKSDHGADYGKNFQSPRGAAPSEMSRTSGPNDKPEYGAARRIAARTIPKDKPPPNKQTQGNNARKNNFMKQKRDGGGGGPAKKNNGAKAKSKAKKPKHLKRKMDQLSKTIGGGGDAEADAISDLEGKMKELAEQMEALKRLKQNKIKGLGQKERGAVDSNEAAGPHVFENDQVADDSLKGIDKDVRDKENKETANSDSSPSPVDGKVKNEKDDSRKGSDDIKSDKENRESADSDSSPSSDDDEGVDAAEQTKSDAKVETEASSGSSSSSSDDGDSSSSDEDEIAESSNARSRGKRRRGRRDNEPKKQGTDDEDPEEGGAKTASGASNEDPDKEAAANKKTSKKDDKRRCIGRKPVTNYVVGDAYPGTVRYIKPKLGAFIDIGSHSDAFCHISCASDEFVSSVADVLRVGDAVENARVVEIDREKKRITVSLQSEEGAAREEDRLRGARQREGGWRNGYDRRNEAVARDDGPPKVGHDPSEGDDVANDDVGEASPAPNMDRSESGADPKRERKLARRAERRAQKVPTEDSPEDGPADGGDPRAGSLAAPSGPKSGADLKRERKLARRAERRAAREAGV